MSRSYSQFCPAAQALDVIGERWTLLIVRELLLGPRRYTDLQMPGLSPTLLAERLRALESCGVVVRRESQPPAYELSELGEALRPVMEELYRWGMRVLSAPADSDSFRASWLLATLQTTAGTPAEVTEAYEFRVGDEVVSLSVGADRVVVREGAAADPALVVTTDHATLAALGTGRTTVREAMENGDLIAEGEAEAGARCAALFGVLEAASVA